MLQGVAQCVAWCVVLCVTWSIPQGKKSSLEELTEEDVKILEEIDEENDRKGAFRRIFPQVTYCQKRSMTVSKETCVLVLYIYV